MEKQDIEGGVSHIEDVKHDPPCITIGLTAEEEEFLKNYPESSRKKLLRKIDWRLIPMLLLLYLIAYLDKVNIGNAKIEGLIESLHMHGNDYSVAVSVFFAPYILAEVPSNMILLHVKRPSFYLGGMVLIWGTVMTCTGVIKNLRELIAIRFLLGLFEAGLFPGAILVISRWYMPDETQTRVALLYTSAASGGALSGLLAFGIAKMDGIGGYEGWRWIFILEGLFTVVVGFFCLILLIDSPSHSSKWLTQEEIRYLELRQYARQLAAAKSQMGKSGIDLKALKSVLKDWKMYFLIFANWSQAVPNYALKFSMPTIIKEMGFKSANAQLLTIPPYTLGAISSYILSRLSDRYVWRMPFIVIPQCAVVIGYSILSAKAAHIRSNIPSCYFAVCMACFGLYPILPGVNAWNISNCPSQSKRAISIAYLICCGNIGGVIGSYIFKSNEAPTYPTGYGTSLAFAVTGIVAALSLEYFLHLINQRNAKLAIEEIHSRYTEEELREMGEKSPLYKYTL